MSVTSVVNNLAWPSIVVSTFPMAILAVRDSKVYFCAKMLLLKHEGNQRKIYLTTASFTFSFPRLVKIIIYLYSSAHFSESFKMSALEKIFMHLLTSIVILLYFIVDIHYKIN